MPSFQRSVDDEGDRRSSAGSGRISGQGLQKGIPVGPGLSRTKEEKSVKGNKNPEIHDAAFSEQRCPVDGSMG